tara:strand:- start:564 stop:1295 length:732 start_codon:yes stop_codon:yes gene_type:complete
MVEFSIITVTFNAENSISKTLKSINRQKYVSLEHIIIDKYSKDKTVELIKKNKTKKTILFQYNDKGIYDAMNIGIKKSKGDYLIFLNSGDEFYNDKILHKTNKIIKKVKKKIFYGYTYLKETKKFIYPKNLKNTFEIPYCHQSIFIKRDIIKKYPFNIYFKYAADYDQFYKLKKYSFNYLNFCISKISRDGVTNKYQNLTFKEYFYINKKNNKKFIFSYVRYVFQVLRFYFKVIIKYVLLRKI